MLHYCMDTSLYMLLHIKLYSCCAAEVVNMNITTCKLYKSDVCATLMCQMIAAKHCCDPASVTHAPSCKPKVHDSDIFSLMRSSAESCAD